MEHNLGPDWRLVVKREIIKSLARSSFTELATLKVAARSYKELLVFPEVKTISTTNEILEALKKANPEEVEKRPRVMEALANLIKEYIKKKGKSPNHLIQLVPWCMRTLKKKGYFDSDIFPKPQHGGDREIHVLEIMARVCQYHIETIARTLCRMVPSDSLTHPSEKDQFVKKHYQVADMELGSKYFTLGKSADATKWCQRNHCSKFAAMLVPLLDKIFVGFCLSLLWLWLFKRISFPVQFAANFIHNRDVKSNNIYERMRSEFFEGKGIFPLAKNNKMIISSGMMQGILHFLGSLMHAIIQVVMMMIQMTYLARKEIKAHITIIQGSDDSAELLSIQGFMTKKLMRLATTMLHWKEQMSEYFSVYTSRAKSSIGTIDMIEYNSEWFVKSHLIKPTFRWVSACLETSVVERFIDRVRTNYNTLAQVLEGGGKTLECSIIQISQAWLHYMLLGLHESVIARDARKLLEKLKDPALGYYPLDSDFIAGITGVEFQLYALFMRTSYGSEPLSHLMDPDFAVEEDEEEILDRSISKDLRSTKLRFGKMTIWYNLLRRMEIPELESIVQEIEDEPNLIFQTYPDWERSKYQVYLKVFQPSVKESLARFSPVARMMASSAYVLSRPCVSYYKNNKLKKLSLYGLLIKKVKELKNVKKSDPERAFTHANEYSEVLDYVTLIEENHQFAKQKFKTRTKQKIVVFEKHTDDVSVIEMCKRSWKFPSKIPLSSRQYSIFWEELKLKYTFLHDSLDETKEALGMTAIEVKNFVESLDTKTRHIVLLDTSAKSASLYSSVTRLFWSNTKLVLPDVSEEEESSFSLRSKMFSILTSWLSDVEKTNFISDLLLNSELLRRVRVPARVKKLKIIRDRIAGVNKDDILKEVEREKLGCVGFFSVRQKGYGKTRSGLGIWLGRCLGIPVKVEMMGNTCKSITFSHIADLHDVGQLMHQLIEGFSLNPPETDEHESSYWLTGTGKIVGGKGNSTWIPIYVEQDLDISIIDEMSSTTWFIRVSENKIRILSEIDRETKITIISDSYSSYDWDPNFPVESPEFLKNWSQGSVINLSMLEEEIASSVVLSAKSILECIRKQNQKLTRSGWSLALLMSNIKQMLVNEDTEEEHEESVKISQEEMDDINMLLNAGEEDADLAEIVGFDQEDGDLFELGDDVSDELLAQMDLFSMTNKVDFTPTTKQWVMPKTNPAFDGINILSKIQLGCTLSQAVKDFKKDTSKTCSGFLAIILSLLTKRVCLKFTATKFERQLAVTDLDAISLTTSLRTDSDVMNLDVEDIEENILYLTNQMLSAPRLEREAMIRRVAKYERIVALKKQKFPKEDSVEGYTVVDFFERAKEKLFHKMDLPNSLNSLSIDVFSVVLRGELSNKIDELAKEGDLTLYEQTLYREAISKHYVTTLLIDSFTMRFNLPIQVSNYRTGEDATKLI
jgi:hypothetical protein